MRILLLSPLPPPAGGMAMWTKQYIGYMKRYNAIDVVNTGVIGKRSLKYSERHMSEEIKRSLLILAKTLKLLMTKQYDIVHFNTSCSGSGLIRDYYLMRMIHIFNKKIILHCHCNLNYALHSEIQKKYFRRMLAVSKKCITLNSASARFVEDNCSIKTLTVPNFIDDSYNAVLKNEKATAPEIKRVLYVGHLLHTKGCDNIIRTAKKFPDIEFRLVGHVFKEIAEMPRTKNVVLTGELDRKGVDAEYRQADIMLFPTHTEGFPLVVVEAMAYGLPFITTKVGAIEDILEDKGAVYVPVDDDDAIESALKSLIYNVDRRRQMSRFNRTKVKEHYLIDTVLDNMQQIYEENL